jgi:hypothetical protein
MRILVSCLCVCTLSFYYWLQEVFITQKYITLNLYLHNREVPLGSANVRKRSERKGRMNLCPPHKYIHTFFDFSFSALVAFAVTSWALANRPFRTFLVAETGNVKRRCYNVLLGQDCRT